MQLFKINPTLEWDWCIKVKLHSVCKITTEDFSSRINNILNTGIKKVRTRYQPESPFSRFKKKIIMAHNFDWQSGQKLAIWNRQTNWLFFKSQEARQQDTLTLLLFWPEDRRGPEPSLGDRVLTTTRHQNTTTMISTTTQQLKNNSRVYCLRLPTSLPPLSIQ